MRDVPICQALSYFVFRAVAGDFRPFRTLMFPNVSQESGRSRQVLRGKSLTRCGVGRALVALRPRRAGTHTKCGCSPLPTGIRGMGFSSVVVTVSGHDHLVVRASSRVACSSAKATSPASFPYTVPGELDVAVAHPGPGPASDASPPPTGAASGAARGVATWSTGPSGSSNRDRAPPHFVPEWAT